MPPIKGESKQGLVVTLVFFILATIGLGVATYYGMAEQDKLKQEAKKEADKVKIADAERDYFRLQSAILRSYLGAPPAAGSPAAAELANKPKFDDGKDFATKYAKDYPEAKGLLDKVTAVKELRWDPATNQPATNVFALLKTRDDEIKDLKVKLQKLEKERIDAQAQRTTAEGNLKVSRELYDKKVKEMEDKFAKEFQDYKDEMKNALTKLEKDVKDKAGDILKIVDDRLALKKEIADMQKKIRDYAVQVANLQEKEAIKEDQRPLELIPRGKIVRVHGNLRRATIDIGRGQNLKPGTTFAVYGLAPNGKPKLRSKGKVEVITVGDNTSEVDVTYLFDPNDPGDPVTGKRKEISVLSRDNTDPIVSGDVLVNPLWNPNAETHVAIAGVVDFQGTGSIDIQSFIRLLEKQNIRVDAYVDPRDGTVKGPGMTRRTDFLVLGGVPTGREPGVSKDSNVLKMIDEATRKLLGQARSNAVTLINPRRFLQDTGLNIPRTVEHD
jgi:hypothetical protein